MKRPYLSRSGPGLVSSSTFTWPLSASIVLPTARISWPCSACRLLPSPTRTSPESAVARAVVPSTGSGSAGISTGGGGGVRGGGGGGAGGRRARLAEDVDAQRSAVDDVGAVAAVGRDAVRVDEPADGVQRGAGGAEALEAIVLVVGDEDRAGGRERHAGRMRDRPRAQLR